MPDTATVALASVVGRPGLAADLVIKSLADAGHLVHTGEADEHHSVVVLVEPRPADWLQVDDADAVIVFALSPPDASTLAGWLRRGARAVVDGEAEVDAVVRAVETVGAGHVVLTARQVELLLHDPSGAVVDDEDVPLLSPRERRILASIARGESVKQTARLLGTSDKTIEHLQCRLHLKLGVRNRAHAVMRAYALGLLPEDLASA